jgi:hypothetical protein
MDANLADTPGLNEIKLKFSLVEIKKKFGVNRVALYGRMRYLQITTWKESNGRAYLDADQMRYMEELDAHMKANHGRMEGYPVPEPSGPQTSIATTVNAQVSTTDQSEVIAPERIHSPNVIDLQAVHDAGMNKAIGIMLAENAIASQYLSHPELLPDEWKQKIATSSSVPKVDPFAFAASLNISVPFNAAISSDP